MPERVELELDLTADGQAGYHVTARSAAGNHVGRLLLDPGSVLAQRATLQTTLLASAVTPRGLVDELEAPVREVGESLFHALFDDHVYAAYKASLALAAERGTQLRVVLRTQLAELTALPWEMMYDPDTGAYLCQREPLVRHIATSSLVHPLEVDPPLRVLGVVSAPRDRQRLDVDGEKQRLEDALTPLGSRVALRWVTRGRWTDVSRELIAESWHVLHFVGHGGFNDHEQEGALVLENDQGGSDLVGAERFSDLLSLQETPLRLVLLNSCAGGQSAADDPFSSSAATLIRSGVSAVVAMQFAVSDPAAMAFSAGFYQAIAHNRTVAEAVRIGRIGIRGIGERTLEWVTPVVYLRGEDKAMFDVLPPPGGPGQELSPEEAAREAAALALYREATAHLEEHRLADAVARFDTLLADRDDYRDAASLREQARRELEVAEAYAGARAAGERGDWVAAERGYAAVLALDPHRAGVQDLLDRARLQVQVASLQEDLRRQVASRSWPAAVAVADVLQQLSPLDSDPDGLATLARSRKKEAELERQQELQRQEEQERQQEEERRRREERRGRRKALLTYVGAPTAAVLLVGGGLAIFWPDGPVPEPFRSSALYELARHHFEPGECEVPQSRNQAPKAWDLPHTELLKCERTDGSYSGTLFCAGSQDDYQKSRQEFLDEALEDPQPVTGPPAGRDEPWPFQVSFQHAPAGEGRVLWDDESAWCFAEMQVDETDVAVAVDHFETGLES